MTGFRAATAYGSYLASEFGASLAERGLAVISEASLGVDAAARRGALAVGGTTIAVLMIRWLWRHVDCFGWRRERCGRSRYRDRSRRE
ncbi:MAG: DNA-processing protein DprA [Trebonia sp.]